MTIIAWLALMVVGTAAIVWGAETFAEHLADASTRLGLTIVGFATAFELVVLAFSAIRHGITEAVVAAVIGSYAYNMTMSLGVGALVAPIGISDSALLHAPLIAMLVLLAVAILLGLRSGHLARRDSFVLFAGYPIFIIIVATF